MDNFYTRRKKIFWVSSLSCSASLTDKQTVKQQGVYQGEEWEDKLATGKNSSNYPTDHVAGPNYVVGDRKIIDMI